MVQLTRVLINDGTIARVLINDGTIDACMN